MSLGGHFSYLSHTGVGMSQLDHHREVRGCELKDKRSFVSILASPSVSTGTLGAAVYRMVQSTDVPRNPQSAVTDGHPAMFLTR